MEGHVNKIVLIDNDKCTGCNNCVTLCPKDILVINSDNKCSVTDESECDRLGGCQRVCPTGAIKIK
jgi:2-oxoglutarate ferredoxin oxidoreductase subunit delta